MSDPTPRRAAISAAPTPTSPVNGAVAPLDAVTFSWSAPPGASRFGLRIAMASDAGTPVFDVDGLEATEFTLADALPPGDALWWVRQAEGAWSAPARFRAGTAADVEAFRQAEETAVETRRADVRAARADVLSGPPSEPVWPHETGEALDGAPPADWASVPGFTAPVRADVALAAAPAPTPLSPLGGEIVDAITTTLQWTATPDATGYDVELSPDLAFGHAVLALDAGQATEIGLSGLVPAVGHRLLWRVRARLDSPDGPRATPWSGYGRFYPAGIDAADAYGVALAQARAASHRHSAYERATQRRDMDLLSPHERPDAISTDAAVWTILGFVITSGTVIAIASLYILLMQTGG